MHGVRISKIKGRQLMVLYATGSLLSPPLGVKNVLNSMRKFGISSASVIIFENSSVIFPIRMCLVAAWNFPIIKVVCHLTYMVLDNSCCRALSNSLMLCFKLQYPLNDHIKVFSFRSNL